MKKIFLTFVLLAAVAFSVNAQVKWKFDKAHSNIGFSVSHMVISDVEGEFQEFEGTVTSDGEKDFSGANVSFTVDINSIDTDNKDRDDHLKSPDFFKAGEYPEMTFISKSFEKTGEDEYKLTGDLTIRGNTHEVTLDVEYGGTVKDPWGNTRAGFEITGEINRFEYGLEWNNMLETGGLVVGKEVEIEAHVELIKE